MQSDRYSVVLHIYGEFRKVSFFINPLLNSRLLKSRSEIPEKRVSFTNYSYRKNILIKNVIIAFSTRKERKGLKRKSSSRKSVLQDRRIEREGFAPSLKKRATPRSIAYRDTDGRTRRPEREKWRMRKERKTKKKKKWNKEKRKDGGKLRQYIRKTKLLLLSLDIVSVAVDVTYLCFLYTCARCVLMCGLRLPPQFLHLPASIASACFPTRFRKSKKQSATVRD